MQGKNLSAYIAGGIDSDHESTSLTEVKEKLSKGMFILLREGSAARNLIDLLPAVNERNSQFFGFCTDDRHPDFLMDKDHINQMVKTAIRQGINPITAFKMASYNISSHYNLNQYGALSIGYYADMIVFDNPNNLKITKVFKKGKLVVDNGKLINPAQSQISTTKNSVQIPVLKTDHFKIPIQGKKVNVIEIIPNQIVTNKCIVSVDDNIKEFISDIKNDLVKIAVIERHHGTGQTGIGILKGLGLKKGAICSTIAHDSHNIIVVGVNDNDMHIAVQNIRKIKGGLTVVCDGKILANLSLPFAGIMSEKTLHTVRNQYDNVTKEAKKLIYQP